MRLPTFEYLEPGNLEEALEMLAKHGDEAMVLAGGTDLLVRMKQRLASPTLLISLKNVGDLSDVVQSPFGYHIIKLTGRKEGKIRSLEEVKERIRVQLLSQARRRHMDEELEKLKKAANLKIDDDAVAAWQIPGTSPPAPRKR